MLSFLYILAVIFYAAFIYFWLEFGRIVTNPKLPAITKPFIYTGVVSIVMATIMSILGSVSGYGPVQVLSFGMIAPIPY